MVPGNNQHFLLNNPNQYVTFDTNTIILFYVLGTLHAFLDPYIANKLFTEAWDSIHTEQIPFLAPHKHLVQHLNSTVGQIKLKAVPK